MDPAAMQNYLLAASAGSAGIPFSIASLTNQQNNDANNNNLQEQQNATAALAGYPALMRSYIMQQQQQQQAAAAANPAYADPRLALFSNEQIVSGNNAFGGLTSAARQGFLPQGLGQLDQRNPSVVAPDYMDANRMLLQRLQGGQQQQQTTGLMSNIPSGGGDNGDPYSDNGILGPWSATSAGLLGKMAVNNQDKGKKARRKPKDKPKRPLSAYNIFFKEERHRILDKIPDEEEEKKNAEGGSESGADAKSRKRKKRPHGKIGFENLAKVIGQRWQNLDPDQVVYYKKKAEEDMKRYKDQMEEYLAKQNEVAKKNVNSINDDFGKDHGVFDITNPMSKRAKLED